MAKRHAANGQRPADEPADALGQIGIVIAEDPVPFAALLERRQFVAVLGVEPACELAPVKAVAKRHHAARPEDFDAGSEPLKRAPRIVRRQHHAACGEGSALLKMQIGDQEGVFRLPVEGAGGDRKERVAGKLDGLPASGETFKLSSAACRPIASAINSSTASRSKASLASPGTLSRPISSMTGTASGETSR